MQAKIRQLIQEIHDNPGRVMVVTAGAGTQALAWLLGVAGASRTLLEALILYEETSFVEYLGHTPSKYVAPTTARLMAGRAVSRAQQLCQDESDVIGLACTATIVTDRPKRGEHRAHVATWTKNMVVRYSLHLSKGARDRSGEEEMVSRLMLNALAKAYGLDRRISLPLLDSDRCSYAEEDLAGAVGRLYQENTGMSFIIGADGSLHKGVKLKALLSGSFNPLHRGHLNLAETAAKILDQEVIFELPAMNADKPSLEKPEVLSRLLQFAGRHQVLVSNAPTFVAKARLFPDTTFVMGYDTAVRL
ncbi:MAG: adenylyltransferase/cytidyltransferase family protein, partial [Chloroflexota bacterium]